MREDKAKCTEYYNSEASVYDLRRFRCKCQNFYDELFKETIFRYFKHTQNLLEAGTGTGRFATYLAQQGKTVIALDYSWEMLNEARKKSIAKGVNDKIYFVRGDIENLPFKKNAFDGVFSIHVIIHFKDLKKIFAEFSRTLKTEGVIVFEHAGIFSRVYAFLRVHIFKKQYSYPDYHHSFSSIENGLKDKNIEIQETKKIKKIPRLLLHIFLCVFSFNPLLTAIKKMEELNFGMVKILKGIKIK